MENLRKKNQTERKNTVEGHSRRLEKVEDRISELKDKIEIKEKNEQQLVKQLKTIASKKKIKYLGVNLTKYVNDLYKENNIPLKKEI
jgi:TolA-binding protein